MEFTGKQELEKNTEQCLKRVHLTTHLQRHTQYFMTYQLKNKSSYFFT